MPSTPSTNSRLRTYLPGSLLAAAWLVPNHYLPWPAAWGDALAILGLLVFAFSLTYNSAFDGRISWQIASICIVIAVTVLAQSLTGKLLYAGDVLVTLLYVGSLCSSVVIGRSLTSKAETKGLNTIISAWVVAAILSTGIACVQWTKALNLGIYAADLSPGGRPFANLAQPNNFSTLCFLGLCGLLWLYQLRRANGFVLWLGISFLIFGMVMSQSRTGWLQIGGLAIWVFAFRASADLRFTKRQMALTGALFVAGVLLWPAICETLFLSSGRSLDEQMRTGVRLPYWWAMLDAVIREPLWGYGWQQIGEAQQRIALDHPSIGVFFEHSHNLVLDLLLWNGIPIASLIIGALVWWIIAHVRECRDARIVWLLAMIGGVLTHAMLELPLEYAYFLIPVGLMVGAIEGLSPVNGFVLHTPRWLVLVVNGLLGLAFVLVAADYLAAEENHRALRMESAHIGSAGIVTPAANLRLLTQLEAMLLFARTEATPDMKAEQVDWMRKVSMRFGYPPVMFRYALATGLNGQPDIARDTLSRICRIHGTARCSEAHDAWIRLQERYPQLTAIQAPEPTANTER